MEIKFKKIKDFKEEETAGIVLLFVLNGILEIILRN